MEHGDFETTERETILVIDNDQEVGRVVERVLVKAGYRVLRAATAAEGLSLAQEHRGKLDLLITDLIMPGMNGRLAAERISAKDPRVRVLFMSGYTKDLLEEEDADVEGAAFLAKPFSAKSLVQRVGKVIHPERAH